MTDAPPVPTDRAATVSPWVELPRAAWAHLRSSAPLTLDEADLARLRGIGEPVDLDEIVEVYLPLSRLLNLSVAGVRDLHAARARFLGASAPKVPFVLAIAGSVAVGKSTTARILRTLLARWPDHPRVELVPTDGFLLPNAELERRGLLERKGFPESYDLAALVRFVAAVKSGVEEVAAPVYSHLTYDVVPGERAIVRRPDVLILEGLNVLQPSRGARTFVSDYIDFSIYVDADVADVRRWYVERFMTLRETAFRDERSYFARYAELDPDAARAEALRIWTTINEVNLVQNVAPTRARSDLVLRKGPTHEVESVAVRKL